MELYLIMTSNITLLNMDCMEYMAGLPDKAFDLAIVDPPYGLGDRLIDGGSALDNRALRQLYSGWDNEVPPDKYFYELMRVSANQVIWGGNYFKLPPTRGIICWDKVQPWQTFSAWEMAWTSFDAVARIFKFDNRTGNKIHPTQKPVALYEWLLTNYAKSGQRILDTHLGSGSSAIAAYNLGFEFVGMELDEDYYKAAVERFNKHKSQERLFDPVVINNPVQEALL